MADWYPQKIEELNELLESYLKDSKQIKKIKGIIAPHAGYIYSGTIAGKAYSLLKDEDNENKTAIIISPSHYFPLKGIASHNHNTWKTTLGEIKIIQNNFSKTDLSREHAIDNQIPFLQKQGFKKILPIIIGEINQKQAKEIAKEIIPYLKNSRLILSSDLSHFLPFKEAIKKDKETIKAISNLDSKKLLSIENSACGLFPLLVFIEIAKIEGWKPKLIEYKNSGDITEEKESVVGYASFSF
jgi:AmmeMemoRadiSam system protein B